MIGAYLPKPSDLPGWRSDVLQEVQRSGHASHLAMFQQGVTVGTAAAHVAQAFDPESAARELRDAEARRLRMAELYFVTSQMTDLAVTASQTLPEFTLVPQDLPSPHGLVVFEKSFATTVTSENQTALPIVAVAWGPWHIARPSWSRGGVWLDFYTSTDLNLATDYLGHLSQSERLAIRTRLGALCHDNEAQIPFDNKPIGRGGGDDTNNWLEVIRTVWMLMGQTIAALRDVRADRATSRRLVRARSYRPDALVRIIELRRRQAVESGPEDATREYYHQWIVRGHWRNQWYPSLNANRPVWIAPHIKGPEGAPLLGGEKIHALKR